MNDLGTTVDGGGAPTSVADEVVAAIKAAGGTAVANHDSVSDFAGAERIIATAVKEFGAIDVLVNNAGILRDRMIFNMAEEDWDAVIAVHLKGSSTARATRPSTCGSRSAAASSPCRRRRGRFGNPGQANYGAAKDGIAAMTRASSRASSEYGVTVNAVCPARRRA